MIVSQLKMVLSFTKSLYHKYPIMLKRIIIICLLFIPFHSAFSNTPDSIKVEKVKIDFSGFFRADYWYDSRQIVDAIDGLFMLYPKAPDPDFSGRDINAAPSVNMLAVATRLRAGIKMPDL